MALRLCFPHFGFSGGTRATPEYALCIIACAELVDGRKVCVTSVLLLMPHKNLYPLPLTGAGEVLRKDRSDP